VVGRPDGFTVPAQIRVDFARPHPENAQVSQFGNRTARRRRHTSPGDAFAARPEPTVMRAFSEPCNFARLLPVSSVLL
jgi:hypothetical protein